MDMFIDYPLIEINNLIYIHVDSSLYDAIAVMHLWNENKKDSFAQYPQHKENLNGWYIWLRAKL